MLQLVAAEAQERLKEYFNRAAIGPELLIALPGVQMPLLWPPSLLA
jgi:hypothetical protein